MFTRILVPLDGSAFSEAALPVAAALARGSGADVELFSALDVALPLTAPGGELAGSAELAATDVSLMGDMREAIRERRDEELQRTAGRCRDQAGLEVSVEMAEGMPADAIRERVEAIGADLIVMSTHGRGRLERAWLGSVADRVVREVRIPVLLVRPLEEEAEVDLATPPVVQRVVVALDGSRLAEAALGPATRMAAALQVPITLIRVIGGHVAPASTYIPHAAAEERERLAAEREEATDYLAAVARRLEEGEARVAGREVVDGPVVHTLLDALDPDGRDVLAMATHGRGGVRRMVLGSVSDKVLRAAVGPVLVVRPVDESR